MIHNYKILGESPVRIVIEMGLGACISEWMPFAKEISTQYGVLVYERAGVNRSESSDKDRTPENIATELMELLAQINCEEKIILLAHSQGGLYAMQFYEQYPEKVRGVILLDPLSPSDSIFKETLTSKEYKKSGVDKSANLKILYIMSRLKLGALIKKMMKNAPPIYYYSRFDEEEKREILGCVANPIHIQTSLKEYKLAHDPENLESFDHKDQKRNIPIILITHSSEMAIEESMKFGNNTREFAARVEELWQSIMKVYLEYSSQATWLRAEKSTHFIHLMEPEIIVNALEQMMN